MRGPNQRFLRLVNASQCGAWAPEARAVGTDGERLGPLLHIPRCDFDEGLVSEADAKRRDPIEVESDDRALPSATTVMPN